MSELTKFYLRVNPLTDVAYMASEGTPKVGTPRYYLAADVERVFADQAARVAELERKVAERANWVCPETYALTLQAVAIEAEAKDRAERRLGEVRAAFVEMGEMMAGMYQAAGEHEKARVLRQKLNELKDQPA